MHDFFVFVCLVFVFRFLFVVFGVVVVCVSPVGKLIFTSGLVEGKRCCDGQVEVIGYVLAVPAVRCSLLNALPCPTVKVRWG